MRQLAALPLWFMVCLHAQTYTISTFAGGGLPVNLAGASASLGLVTAVAADSDGNVFIASGQYNVVLRLDAKTGVLTLVAGNGTVGFSGDNGPATSAQLNLATAFFHSGGLAVDSAGNVYIADESNLRVRKVSNGVITTVAGIGLATGPPREDGTATNAQLSGPISISVDSAGALYIGDGNHLVRKVSNRAITTVAGNGTFGSSGDNGPATSAQVLPVGVAVDASGNLYIADQSSSRIRKVANGVITTVAGNGTGGSSGDNGPATSAQVSPSGIAIDSAGNLYIADMSNRIRKVSSGVITTVAGNGTVGYSGDNGPAVSAQLSSPIGVTADSLGNLYIADEFNNRIRKVANGVITSVAGGGLSQGDSGPATSVALANPAGVDVDSSGSVYVADSNRIRKISNGMIATVSDQFTDATSVAVDSAHNLFVADSNRIREISNGAITTVAGGGSSQGDGPATSTALTAPSGVVVDSAHNLFIADGNRIREVSNGLITTVAGGGSSQGDNGPATSAQLLTATGIAVDSAGTLYIADQAGGRVRKISNGVITTVAGGGSSLGDNGPAPSAQITPTGVAVDAVGNLYISDQFVDPRSGLQPRIRKVSNGVISTVAGNGTLGFSGDNGPATKAALSNPTGIAVDSSGKVYFADTGSHRIRVLVPDCAYNISSSIVQSTSAGGSFPITVQTDASCLWTISGFPNWISLATPPAVAGTAQVSLVITSNTGAARLSTLLVGGLPVIVNQAPAAGFAPATSLVANAFGESSTIAPNTWVEIKGSNLAPAGDTRTWRDSDFVNNRLPTVLDGVSVTMNGKNAYVYYISTNQINVLTPADLTPGPVQVNVIIDGVTSAVFTVPAQQSSPSFFVYNGGPYVIAVHSDSSRIGPSSLFPALTTPAKPGETIALFANGFGSTSPSVVSGAASQSGSLPTLPLVKIGGAGASVQFAGLISPGLFQFNIVVPALAADGDNAIEATYNGVSTQAGTLLAVQH